MRQAPLRVALVLSAALGCAGHTTAPDGGTAPDGDTFDPAALTYWNDIAPIINDKCVRCHQTGGIGPFPLDNYGVVKMMAATIAGVTKINYMPPFLITHDGSCGQFEDAEALSAGQIARLDAWSSGDRKEGTARSLTRPAIPGVNDGDAYATPTIVPRAEGSKLAPADELRCFPLPSQRAEDGFITAFQVRPGNDALVQEVVVYLVDPDRRTGDGRSNAQVMKALDDADPDRPGWPCYRLAGPGVEVEGTAAFWAPGQGPVVYPPSVGVRHRKGVQLVVQMHYNIPDQRFAGMTDTTTIHLRYAPTVDRRALFLFSDPFVDTLDRAPPDALAPGMMEASYTWKKTAGELGMPTPSGASLLAVMPHMHQRGVRQQMTIGTTCAAQLKQWNFSWQRIYFYKGTPPALGAGTPVSMTCTYNTMTDTMPVPPGFASASETCSAVLLVALPPGM